jgi:hypothetical protein
MRLAVKIYNELTGFDDPDDYAPPLLVSLLAAVITVIPWRWIGRILGLTFIAWVAIISCPIIYEHLARVQ